MLFFQEAFWVTPYHPYHPLAYVEPKQFAGYLTQALRQSLLIDTIFKLKIDLFLK